MGAKRASPRHAFEQPQTTSAPIAGSFTSYAGGFDFLDETALPGN